MASNDDASVSETSTPGARRRRGWRRLRFEIGLGLVLGAAVVVVVLMLADSGRRARDSEAGAPTGSPAAPSDSNAASASAVGRAAVAPGERRVFGIVRDLAGAVVGGVPIAATFTQGGERTATAGPDGRFAFGVPERATWVRLAVRLPEHFSTQPTLRLVPGMEPVGATLTVAPWGGIAALVTRDGLPIERVRVTATKLNRAAPAGAPAAAAYDPASPASFGVLPAHVAVPRGASAPDPLAPYGLLRATQVLATTGGRLGLRIGAGLYEIAISDLADAGTASPFRAEVRLAPGETVQLAVPLGGVSVLRGRVTDRRRPEQPVAGASLTVYRLDPARGPPNAPNAEPPAAALRVRLAEATSDAGGRFVLRLSQIGPATLVVAAPGYARLGRDLRLVPGETTLRLSLDPGVTLAGRVTTTTGAAVAGARLLVRTDPVNATDAAARIQRWSATTDAAGRYRLTRLPPGARLRVRVEAGERYPPAETRLVLAGDDSRCDFRLKAGTRVELTLVPDSGTELPAITRLELQWDESEAEVPMRRLDRTAGVAPGAPGGVPGDPGGSPGPPGSDDAPGAAPRLPDGSPPLRPPDESQTYAAVRGRHTLKPLAGKPGSFVAEGVFPGPYLVIVQFAGVVAPPDEPPIGGRLTVPARSVYRARLPIGVGVSISGRLTSKTAVGEDRPLAGAKITLVGTDPLLQAGGLSGGARFSVRTDANGDYRIAAVGRGRWILRAVAADHLAVRREVVVAGESQTIDLRLQPGETLSGSARTPEGKPVARLRLALDLEVDASGAEPVAPGDQRQIVTTDEAGAFSFRGLAPGTYALRKLAGPGFLADDPQEVRVPAGRPLAVTVIAGARVTGSVVDVAGAPVAHASVRLVPLDARGAPLPPPARGFATLGTTAGTFALPSVRPGPYAVRLEHAGHPTVERQVTIVAPATRLRLAFARGLTVAGRLTRRGAPGGSIADWTVRLTPVVGDGAGNTGAPVPGRRGATVFVGDDGRFTFTGLRADRYWLSVYDRQSQLLYREPEPLELSGDLTGITLDVLEQPRGALAGRVVDSTGRELGGVALRFVADNRQYDAEAGRDGRFGLTPVIAGSYAVRATLADGRALGLVPASVTVAAGAGAPIELRVAKVGRGLLVRAVQAEGAAARAGLQSGDLLLTYAGRPTDTVHGLARLMRAHSAERAAITLGVTRGGVRLALTVSPGSLGVEVAPAPLSR